MGRCLSPFCLIFTTASVQLVLTSVRNGNNPFPSIVILIVCKQMKLEANGDEELDDDVQLSVRMKRWKRQALKYAAEAEGYESRKAMVLDDVHAHIDPLDLTPETRQERIEDELNELRAKREELADALSEIEEREAELEDNLEAVGDDVTVTSEDEAVSKLATAALSDDAETLDNGHTTVASYANQVSVRKFDLIEQVYEQHPEVPPERFFGGDIPPEWERDYRNLEHASEVIGLHADDEGLSSRVKVMIGEAADALDVPRREVRSKLDVEPAWM